MKPHNCAMFFPMLRPAWRRFFPPALFAACVALLAACGPKSPEPTRVISARQLLTAEDCAAYYNVPFTRSNESFLGDNPPTVERDHVTMMDFDSGKGDTVHLSLDQSVSVEESRKRVREEKAVWVKDGGVTDEPGFGEGGGYSLSGETLKLARPPYRVSVQASGRGDAFDKEKRREAVRHFAKIVDERLKKLAEQKP